MESIRNIDLAPYVGCRHAEVVGDDLHFCSNQSPVFDAHQEIDIVIGIVDQVSTEIKTEIFFKYEVNDFDAGGPGVLLGESFSYGAIATPEKTNFVPFHPFHVSPPYILEVKTQHGGDFEPGFLREFVFISRDQKCSDAFFPTDELTQYPQCDFALGECIPNDFSGAFGEAEFFFQVLSSEVCPADAGEFSHESGGREFLFIEFPVPVVGDHLGGPLYKLLGVGCVGFHSDDIAAGLVKDGYILDSPGGSQFDYPFETTQEVFVSIVDSKDAAFRFGVSEGGAELFGGDPELFFPIDVEFDREVVKLFLYNLVGIYHCLSPLLVYDASEVCHGDSREFKNPVFEWSGGGLPVEKPGKKRFGYFHLIRDEAAGIAGTFDNHPAYHDIEGQVRCFWCRFFYGIWFIFFNHHENNIHQLSCDVNIKIKKVWNTTFLGGENT